MNHLASDLIATREPNKFGQYVVLRRLGEGPLAETLLARDSKMPRGEDLVAVKRLASALVGDEELAAAMLEGAAVAAILDHPNIVCVFDGGTIDETPFVATEHVSGPTLDRLSSGRPMPPEEALYLLAQVCSALEHAHSFVDEGGVEAPLIHGGIRPRAILVAAGGTVKVTGFELAGLASSDEALDAAADDDRRPYLAPEQVVGGALDARTDVFACGALLYRLLTGQDPVSKGGGIPAPRQLVPNLPREIGEIVERAMSPDPCERFPSCEELGRDVAALHRSLTGLTSAPDVEDEEPSGDTQVPAPPRPPKGDTLVGWTATARKAREEALLEEAIEALDDLGASASAAPLLDDDIEELPSVEVVLEETEASAKPRSAPAEEELLRGLAAPRRDPSASEPPRPTPGPRPTPRPRRAVGAAPPPHPPVARRQAPPESARRPSPPPPVAAQPMPVPEPDDDPTIKSQAVDFDALPPDLTAALDEPLAPGAAGSAEIAAPKPRRWGWVVALACVVVVLGGGSAAGALTADLWLPEARALAARVAPELGVEAPAVPTMPSVASVWPSAPATPAAPIAAPAVGVAPTPAPVLAPMPAAVTPPPPGLAAPAVSAAQLLAAPLPMAPVAAPAPEASSADGVPTGASPAVVPSAPSSADGEPERPRRAARPAGTGYLSVLTTPYSRVYMDGRLLGTTPILRRQVPAGRHSLRLVTDDGAARRVPVTVRRDALSQVRQNLW